MFSKLRKYLPVVKSILDVYSSQLAIRGEHQIKEMFTREFENAIYCKSDILNLINKESLESYDRTKKSIIVTSVAYRNIEHFTPLIDRFKVDGFQVIYISCLHGLDPCFFINKSIPALFFDNYTGLNELLGKRYDYPFMLYYLLNNFDVKCILQDEWTGLPLFGFFHGWPKLPDLPPIFSMRHSLSTFYDMPAEMKNFLEKNLTKYFVWGAYHKQFFYKESDKVVAAGYNKLDYYKNIKPTRTKTIFVVGGHLYIKTGVSLNQLLISLLDETDFVIKYKPHPEESHQELRLFSDDIVANSQNGENFIMLDQFGTYVDALAQSDFVISFGSNLVADALALNKPVCLLESNYAHDSIYASTCGRTLLLKGKSPSAKDILQHIENVTQSWDQVQVFKDGLLSNQFNSTEFIFNQILSEI